MNARIAATWREYTIAARRAGKLGAVDVFLAPDLDYAFACARRAWPMATEWTCLGSKPVEVGA